MQLARLALLVAILALWHYAVEQEWLNRIFTATPKEVWDGFIDIVSTQPVLGRHRRHRCAKR